MCAYYVKLAYDVPTHAGGVKSAFLIVFLLSLLCSNSFSRTFSTEIISSKIMTAFSYNNNYNNAMFALFEKYFQNQQK